MQHDDGFTQRGWRREREATLALFARSIALMEAVGRVETALAETLRVLAGRDGGDTAARRLKLAEDAARGARAAASIGERLREQASQWAGRTEMGMLHDAVDHAAAVLAELERAESDIAGILTDLAGSSGPELAVQWRMLAGQASAAAQNARDRAAALRTLARIGRARMRPEGTPVADPADVPAHRGRQRVEDALRRAATAHDRAAGANERSARAGIGDVAEHERMAAMHRAAAEADRRRARESERQVASPQPSA